VVTDLPSNEDRGDCFSAAIRTAGELVELGLHPTIVHGTPVGTAGAPKGQRYWHAWVEIKTDEGWVVIDHSNGKRTQMMRTDYYRLGQLYGATEKVTWRFPIRQVIDMMDRHGHSGPWVDGWEAITVL
jgi:hypothetical protein